jgi:probable selenium-dependent hydroxylase accessory protein YqeC
LFALARLAADSGERVLATTTAHIRDPEAADEAAGKGFAPLVLEPSPISSVGLERLARSGSRSVLASGREGTKLVGISPEDADELARLFDLVLVEADGSRSLPIKAPAAHEPVVPSGTTAVIGLVGLDALGAPMDGRRVHRPELFGPLVGCAEGESISIAHIVALAASPKGLFKNAPASAARIVALNKADLCGEAEAAECARALRASGAADAVLIAAFGARSGAPVATTPEGEASR